MSPAEPIRVWPFYEAPPEFRSLSEHGGDEDFVAFVPTELSPSPLMDMVERMAICDCSEHRVAGGVVLIGAHA